MKNDSSPVQWRLRWVHSLMAQLTPCLPLSAVEANSLPEMIRSR